MEAQLPAEQKTAREVLEIYRATRNAALEIALIDFMDLTEQERWELLFFGALDAWHAANTALKSSR